MVLLIDANMTGPKIRRLYYSSREICDKTGINPVRLRHWLALYPQIRPAKSRSGRLLFRSHELKIIRMIKKYDHFGLSEKKIAYLLDNPGEGDKTLKALPRLILQIKDELEQILNMLSYP